MNEHEQEEEEEISDYFGLMKAQLTPDMRKKYPELLSKEHKLSNITSADREELEEMGDIAFQLDVLGADEARDFLEFLIQDRLCLSSSLHGFQTLAQQTTIQKQIIQEDKKNQWTKAIFDRKGGGS